VRLITHHLIINGQSRPARVTGAGCTAKISLLRPVYCPTKGCGFLRPKLNDAGGVLCESCLKEFALQAINEPIGVAQ